MSNGLSFVAWLESNILSLVLAVLLALIVWVVATQEANPSEEFTFDQPIPIEYIGPDEDLLITNTPARTVTVRVRAPRSAVRSLTLNNFVAVVDLTGLGADTHTVPVEVSIVDAQAVRQDYTPEEVRVVLEQQEEREIPVQLVLEGRLPTGYQTGPVSVNPAEVVVRGAQSAVQLVSEVQVSVSVAERREPLDTSLPLVALDSDGNVIENVEIQPETAQVQVPVFQEADFREVTVVPNIDSLQTAPGYYFTNIRVDPPVVPVRGDPDVLEELNSIETEPISLSGVQSDQTYVAQLRPPDGVTLEDVRTVTVYISVEAQLSFQNVEVPIEVVGLDEGLEASVVPERAVVSLRGPLPVLERLTSDALVVTVDVTGLEPDTYRLEPEAEIISGVIPQEELQQVIIDSVLPTVVQVEVMEAEAEVETEAAGGS